MLLARRLGVEAFGRLALAQVLIQHAILLIEFGYPFGGTQRIAALKEDLQARSAAFSTILACQVALLAAVSLVLACAWMLAPSWRGPLTLVLVGSGALVGSALQPTWLFLGLERLKVLAIVQLASKVAMLAMVWWFVHGPQDVESAIFFLGLPTLLGGCVLLAWSLSGALARWQRPSLAMMGRELRGAWTVFAPGVVSLAYTGLPAVVLGALGSPTAVAHFSLADRLKSAALVVLQPFSTTLIARLSVLFKDRQASPRALLQRSLALHAGTAGVFSCILFLGADSIVTVIGGAQFAGAATVLRWMAFVPLFVAVSTVASLHVLLPSGHAAITHRVVLTVSVVGLMFLWPVVRGAGEVGAAQFLLVSEVACCGLMWWFAIRRIRQRKTSVHEKDSPHLPPA